MIRIKELRMERKMSLRDLSTDLDISYSSLGKYERGEQQPNYDTLIKIANYFNVTVDYLISNSNIRKTNKDELNKQLGLSEEALNNMYGNPELVQFINDLVTHKNFSELERLTYHSRYTRYESIDNGYRSFLTGKLLYSMIADIFKQWYIDNPDRIQELSKSEKQKLISDIEQYFINKESSEQLFKSCDYPKAISLDYDVESQLEALYLKLNKFL